LRLELAKCFVPAFRDQRLIGVTRTRSGSVKDGCAQREFLAPSGVLHLHPPVAAFSSLKDRGFPVADVRFRVWTLLPRVFTFCAHFGVLNCLFLSLIVLSHVL